MIDELVGLKVRNFNDGTEFVFNEHTAPATNIWTRYVNSDRDKLTPDGDPFKYQWTCPVAIPDGYDFQVISPQLAEVTFRQVGDRMYVSGTRDKATYSASDGKVTVRGLGNSVRGSNINNYVKILSFPKVEYQNNSNAGLKVMGNAVFFNEIPVSGYAYAAHKAKVLVNKEFIPGDVFPGLNIDNAIYFFYTDDEMSFIQNEPWTDRNGTHLYGIRYMSRDRRNPNSGSYTTATYWVIAFTNMSSSELNTGIAGLKIRNFDGEVTLNSQFGVMTRPIAIKGNDIPVNARMVISEIKRPMYTPCVIGETFTSNGGAAQFRALNVGNFDGGSVGLFETNFWWTRGRHGDYTVARSSMPAIFLDAADYFNF